MSKLLRTPNRDLSKVDLYDDFLSVTSTQLWTSVLTDSGTASVGDAANGILALVASDGTVADNDEAYIKSTKEIALFANNKPFVFEASIQFSEANTDDANVCVGLMNAVGADSIQDNGAGPAASYSGAVFYKVDGGTTWYAESSLGATQNTTALTDTAGGSAYQKLRIEFKPFSSTQANVAFYINDAHKCSHTLTYTSATEMQLFAGVKNGGANLETLNVDYISFNGVR